MFKIRTLLIVLGAAAVSLTTAADTFETLRKENSELRSKLLAQSRELKQMRLWLAGMISGEAELGKDADGVKTLRLKTISEQGMNLVLKSDAVSKAFRAFLQQSKLNEATRINYILQLDELDAAARSFSGTVKSPDPEKLDMRVINIQTTLNIAVVSGGMDSGIFPGMILYPANLCDSELQFRVVSVRPGVCAVDLKAGSWSEVVPGMALTPFRKR